MRWPTYAAHMLFKFFVSKSNPKEIFVAIDYANEVRVIEAEKISIAFDCSLDSLNCYRTVTATIVRIRRF